MAHYSTVFSEQLTTEIFSSFYTYDATSRQTAATRFDDLNPVTADILQHLPNGPVHDIAVADGSTSLQLQHYLTQNSIQRQVCISDRYSHLFIVDGQITRMYDTSSRMVAAYSGMLCGDRPPPFFIVNRMLYRILQKQMDADASHRRLLTLFTPAVTEALNRGTLQEVTFDLFTPSDSGQYAFIRCMNVLNRGYFSRTQIALALGNINASLVENGMLLLGRTMPDGTNSATFYKKVNNRFVEERKVHKGYECSDVATEGVY